MDNQDSEVQAAGTTEKARTAHWVAPKLHQFRAGDAEAGVSSGPDGPETGTS